MLNSCVFQMTDLQIRGHQPQRDEDIFFVLLATVYLDRNNCLAHLDKNNITRYNEYDLNLLCFTYFTIPVPKVYNVFIHLETEN